MGFGFRVSGFGVQGSGFRVQGLGLKIEGGGFQVYSVGSMVPGGSGLCASESHIAIRMHLEPRASIYVFLYLY